MNLPRGYFEFQYEGATIKGRLCLWSIERFKNRAGIPDVEAFLELLTGMSVQSLSMLLLCCVEYVCLKESKPFPYNETHGYDWIEDLGVEKIVELVSVALEMPEDDGKKKESENASPGGS